MDVTDQPVDSWDDAREHATTEAQANILEQHLDRPDAMGGEWEYQLVYDDGSPVQLEDVVETFHRMASPSYTNPEISDDSPLDIPTSIEMHETFFEQFEEDLPEYFEYSTVDGVTPAITTDLGVNELEIESAPVSYVENLEEQRLRMESYVNEMLPDNVRMVASGVLPGVTDERMTAPEGTLTRRNLEEGTVELDPEDVFYIKRRYDDHEAAFHDPSADMFQELSPNFDAFVDESSEKPLYNVMATAATQTTAQASMHKYFNDDELQRLHRMRENGELVLDGADSWYVADDGTVESGLPDWLAEKADEVYRDYQGAGDYVGIPEVKHFLLYEFINSPSRNNGETDTLWWRETNSYDDTFKDKKYAYDSEGRPAWGLQDKWTEAESISDHMDVLSTEHIEFTAGKGAGKVLRVDDDTPLTEVYGYLEEDTGINLLVRGETGEVYSFQELMEMDDIPGQATMRHADNTKTAETVKYNYRNKTVGEVLDDLTAHESTQWFVDRFRKDLGAWEDRDGCTSPRIPYLDATEIGAKANFRDIQQYFHDLGYDDIPGWKAREQREGVAREGASYVPFPDDMPGVTMHDFMYGTDDVDPDVHGVDEVPALLDVLTSGVRLISKEPETADDYRAAMEYFGKQDLETPAEVQLSYLDNEGPETALDYLEVPSQRTYAPSA